MTNFCGSLQPHDSHTIGVYEHEDDWSPWMRKADRICPGEPLVEGSALCALHQRPLATCQCREERMARWSE
jgi:hypothetical protein